MNKLKNKQNFSYGLEKIFPEAQDFLPLLGTGPEAPLWVSLAVADWAVKLSLALLALIPFRIIVRRLSAQVV